MKIAGMYFLLCLLIINVVGGIFTFLLVNLFTPQNLNNDGNTNFIFITITSLVSLVILVLGTYSSAKIIKKKIGIKNPLEVTKFATIYYIVLESLFLIRDFLITSINEVAITRHFPQTIISSVISVVVFYFLTKRFLHK